MGIANPAFVFNVRDNDLKDYPLQKSTLLDSGSSLHIATSISRFKSFKKAPKGDMVIAGDTLVPIEGYGKVDLIVTRPDGSRRVLGLKKVAYCPSFATSLVSFQLLQHQGIWWDNKACGDTSRLVHKSGRVICQVKLRYGQYVLDYRPVTAGSAAAIATAL